jgi:hypothetical protein
MGLWANIFESDPPPGQCDDGWFVECCADAQGAITCAPTAKTLFAAGPLAVGQGLWGGHDVGRYRWQASELSDDLPTAYRLAVEDGYTGTPEAFAERWNAYHRPGQSPEPAPEAQQASKSLADRLLGGSWGIGPLRYEGPGQSPQPVSMVWIVLGGVAAGAGAAYFWGQRGKTKKK